MDRQDDLGAGRDGGLDLIGVHIEVFADIGENRRRAAKLDGVHRRHPGQRRRDHLVAGPHVERPQAQVKRVGARSDAGGEPAVAVPGDLFLELLVFGAEDETAVIQNPFDRLHKLGLQGRVLDAEIEIGNLHGPGWVGPLFGHHSK